MSARRGRRRALLLNPPGRPGTRRDFMLSGALDAELVLPPEELALASAALPEAELLVVDAVAERLTAQECAARAKAFAPDLVVFMLGAATYEEDAACAAGVERLLPRAVFAGVGGVYSEIRELAFGLHPFLDALVLEPAGVGLAALLEDPAPRELPGLLVRLPDGGAAGRAPGPRRGVWRRGLPRWSAFPLSRYRSPFLGRGPLATIAGERGCEFLCTYCPSAAEGRRAVPVEDFVAEAAALAEVGARKLVVVDPTFGLDRARTTRLLDAWTRAGLGQQWLAATRVDLADAALLEAMRRAGCVAVQLGVDGGDDEVLRVAKKSTTLVQARAAVEAVRRAGMASWGLFVLGLPHDTRETVERTLEAARELPFDRVSVALDAQRHGTAFRKELLIKGLVPPEAMPPDVPTSTSVWQGRLGISNADVFRIHEAAGRARRDHAAV